MIPVYRRFYLSGPRALAATGKSILVYDIPAGDALSVWDAILISEFVIGVTIPVAYQGA